MKKLISVNSSSPVQQLPAKAKKTKRVKRNANPEQNRPYGTSPGRRSSIYRGVTKHRWTGRFEAHLWDKTCWNSVQNKKGRQVYLGAYDEEEAAAHTYDLAALKYWGPETVLNFPLSSYTKEYEEMQNVSKEEYLASLRRRSSGFSRGVSKYRGVARHHHNGRWEARIGRIFGNKYLYLGTYSTQEEAAQAYDLAAIEYRGLNAVTNFDLSHYVIYPQQQQHKQQQHQEQTCTFQESLEVLPPPVILPPPENTDSGNQISGFINGEQSLWSLCMESGYTTLPDSCMVLEKTSEMQDLFNHFSFEDNIDSIFESVEGIDEMNGLNIEGLFGEGGIISLDQIDEPGLIEEPASSMNSISCPCSSPCPSPAISS